MLYLWFYIQPDDGYVQPKHVADCWLWIKLCWKWVCILLHLQVNKNVLKLMLLPGIQAVHGGKKFFFSCVLWKKVITQWDIVQKLFLVLI